MLYEPYQIKSTTIPNRIVMPAMCQYSATTTGFATNWHNLHYGARAVGGVGLIILEATAVEARGRISINDLGIYDEEHTAGLKKIREICHEHGSIMAIQLAHAGRKGCGPGNVSASALAVNESSPPPHSLSQSEISEVIDAWRLGAKRAYEAGFDIIQIHAAHGYLIHQFLSPLSNQRDDEYGGSFTNRIRFLLEIIAAVKTEWPQEKPLSVRLSAVDYLPGGLTIRDTVKISQALKDVGVDLLDISTGGILPAPIKTAPGYQVEFASQVRNQVNIPTIAVGLINTKELAEAILFNQHADFIALGRELLRNPYWALTNSNDPKKYWPVQYERAFR